VSRVIKSALSGHVVRFTGHSAETRAADLRLLQDGQAESAPVSSPEEDAVRVLQEVLMRSERETELLQRELEEAVSRFENQEAEAFERGRREGLQQSDEESTLRLNLLRQALETANANFAGNAAQVETLALQIASAALSRILGDCAERESMMQQLIAYQIERFAQERPTCLRVSRADFRDATILAQIAGDFPELELIADRKLAPGECLLGLELGEVDIGLTGQAQRMEAFFRSLVAERETSAPHGNPGQPV
jgi:flagellar biosynthesis/type III secretory pathway protein FliH